MADEERVTDRPDDDAEGHMPWRHVSPDEPEGTDVEGARRKLATDEPEDDTEGHHKR